MERLKDMNPYRQNEVRDRRRKVAVVVSNVGAIVGCDALSAWLAQPRVDEALDRASEFREIVQSVDPTAEFDSDLRCRSLPMLGGCFPSSRSATQLVGDATTIERLERVAAGLGYVSDGDAFRRDPAGLTIELNDDGTIDLHFPTRWPDTSFLLGD